MNRRSFLSALPALAGARALLAAAGASATSRIGLCTFSCHQHWKAAQAGNPDVRFHDAPGFFRYARDLGADGVQTSLTGMDAALARRLKGWVEAEGGYFEGDLALPRSSAGMDTFEAEVRLIREAGASVARTVLLGGRRYEVFATREEFRRFQAEAEKRLGWAEPILRRHRLRLAVENHKDFTADELAGLMRRLGSEWIGVLVDTGNNLALLEDPQEVVEALAPYVLSTHLKDMAVQPSEDGFLLSEVPPGTGALDLRRMVATLRARNPAVVFNLEMATRDPLRVPCLTAGYFATFPERRVQRQESTLEWVRAHRPGPSPPTVAGKETAQVLREEEVHNRQGLDWMRRHVKA